MAAYNVVTPRADRCVFNEEQKGWRAPITKQARPTRILRLHARKERQGKRGMVLMHKRVVMDADDNSGATEIDNDDDAVSISQDPVNDDLSISGPFSEDTPGKVKHGAWATPPPKNSCSDDVFDWDKQIIAPMTSSVMSTAQRILRLEAEIDTLNKDIDFLKYAIEHSKWEKNKLKEEYLRCKSTLNSVEENKALKEYIKRAERENAKIKRELAMEQSGLV